MRFAVVISELDVGSCWIINTDMDSCCLLSSILSPTDPLSPELIESFQRWLLRASKPTTTPFSVSNGVLLGDAPADLLFSSYLESLVSQEEEQRGPPSGLSRAKDAALGFFTRFSTKGLGGVSPSVSDFSDLRLSHYIAHFGPQHVAGDRVPSASAAASRPPPSFVTLTDGGIKVPTAAAQFAAANGGVWPLMPCRAGSDSAIVADKVACGTLLNEEEKGSGNYNGQGLSGQHQHHNHHALQHKHVHDHQSDHHQLKQHHHHNHQISSLSSSSSLLSSSSHHLQQLQPLLLCPVHTPLMASVKLTNAGHSKAVVSLRPLQSIGEDGSYVLSVEPATLTLKKGESANIHIALRILRPDITVNAFVVVETSSTSVLNSNGRRMLLLVRACSERTYFGVRLADVPTVRSGGYDSIPLPLAQLRDALLEGQDGGLSMLQAEGLFRVAPSADEKNAIRQAIDDGSFTEKIDLNNNAKEDSETKDADPQHSKSSILISNSGTGTSTTSIVSSTTGHIRGPLSAKEKLFYAKRSPIAVAHMIKVFLRELPSPLFSAIPTETLLRAASEEDCIALIGWLTPPASSIFAWLVDLLVEVARHEAHNKMGLKNLAICTGPNLFSTDENVNPMEALMTSQKSVSALFQIISARAQQTEAKGKNGADRDIFADLLGVTARPVKNELVHNELLQKATPTRSSINAIRRELDV